MGRQDERARLTTRATLRASVWAVGAVMLARVLGGCLHSEGALAARDRFEAEFRCDRSRGIRMEDLGTNAFRISGCGRTVMYICDGSNNTFGDPYTCHHER